MKMLTGATDKLYAVKSKVKPIISVLVGLWLFVNVVIPTSKFLYSCNQRGFRYTMTKYTRGEFAADLQETGKIWSNMGRDIKKGWL